MVNSCSAINCTNRRTKGCGKTFHMFPTSRPKILTLWLQNMRRDKWMPSQHSRLCSDHFEDKCFDRTGRTIRLKLDAVPTLFNFTAYCSHQRKIQREKSLPSSEQQEMNETCDIQCEKSLSSINRQETTKTCNVQSVLSLKRQEMHRACKIQRKGSLLSFNGQKFQSEKCLTSLKQQDIQCEGGVLFFNGQEMHKAHNIQYEERLPLSSEQETCNVPSERSPPLCIGQLSSHPITVYSPSHSEMSSNSLSSGDHTYSNEDSPIKLKRKLDLLYDKISFTQKKLKILQQKNRHDKKSIARLKGIIARLEGRNIE